MASKVKIIADINEHLQKSEKKFYSNFYVGITCVIRTMVGQ